MPFLKSASLKKRKRNVMKRMVEKAVVLQICMFYNHLCRQTEGKFLHFPPNCLFECWSELVDMMVRVGISEIQNGPSWYFRNSERSELADMMVRVGVIISY